jgi:hypothetical protein
MGEPACTEMSPTATKVVRGLGSALESVITAMTRDLRTSTAPQDATDRLAVTGAPWRWHLAGGYLIEYRSLKRTESKVCPKGGFFVNNLIAATPTILIYMGGKKAARHGRH